MKSEVPPETVSRAEFLNLFLAVFLPMFMAAVDQTLLATATPAIAASLGGLRDTSWIASAICLASATIVPVYGRLGDLRGRRDLLFVALGVFALGSRGLRLAQSLPQLVAARVLQGLGGGGLMVLSQALIGELVAPRERVRFQGYFAHVFTAREHRRPGARRHRGVARELAVAVPRQLAARAVCRLAAWRLPRGVAHPRPDAKPDLPGHILFAIGAVSGLFWFTSVGHRFALSSPASLALLATAIVTLSALVWHEAAPFVAVSCRSTSCASAPSACRASWCCSSLRASSRWCSTCRSICSSATT